MREDKAEDLSLRCDPQNKKITHRKDKEILKDCRLEGPTLK